jgi:hypothetical protein
VDARLHGQVERGQAVGGEEDDAREVLELLEEDGDEGVALGIAGLLVAGLEEDVGLVEEDNGLPGGGVLKELPKLNLKEPGAGERVKFT